MKRVAHVYSSWTAGGAEKILLTLAEGLERAGLRNVIVAPGDSYLAVEARRRGLTVRPAVIKGSFDPFGILALWRAVSSESIDIVHAHQGKVFWPCVIMKLLRPGTRIVFHRHADLPHRFYSRWHYTFADAVVAISNAVAQGLINRENVPREKLAVIYNGTDLARFGPSVSGDRVRRAQGLDGMLVVGTVAAMNRPRGKGQEYLIEAAAALRGRFPRLRYLIVGTGEILGDLQDIARRRGVADIVIFTGYQEAVEEYMAAMDLFCFLSWDTEGFGQVMVEAQALGKPVIGTAIGGIPETFKDGVTGTLIPPMETEALVAAIEAFAADPALWRGRGAAGAAYVRERFGLDRMVADVQKLYEAL